MQFEKRTIRTLRIAGALTAAIGLGGCALELFGKSVFESPAIADQNATARKEICKWEHAAGTHEKDLPSFCKK